MRRFRIPLLVIAVLAPIVLGLWIAGFDVGSQLGEYVISDSAVVSGDLVKVSSPIAGQVDALLVEVGEPVDRGQPLIALGSSAATSGQVSALAPSSRVATRARAPENGTVVFVPVSRGQTVASGQTVAVLADLGKLWIVANVDETSFRPIRVGQRVETYLQALDRTYDGQVEEILPVAAGLSGDSLTQIQPSTSSGTLKATPQIPVRISFDYGSTSAAPLPGMTATVRIYVRG